MGQVVIGGGNYNLGLRFLEEKARLRAAALAEQERNDRAHFQSQSIGLQQQELGMRQRESQDRQNQYMFTERNRMLSQERDDERWQAERGDRAAREAQLRTDMLDERGYRRGQDQDETQYRRGRDGTQDARYQDETTYRRGRDTLMDQRMDAKLAQDGQDRDSNRALREWEIEQRSGDKRMQATMQVADAQLRGLERQLQQAVAAGRDDLVGQLEQQIAEVEAGKAAALQAAADPERSFNFMGPRQPGGSTPAGGIASAIGGGGPALERDPAYGNATEMMSAQYGQVEDVPPAEMERAMRAYGELPGQAAAAPAGGRAVPANIPASSVAAELAREARARREEKAALTRQATERSVVDSLASDLNKPFDIYRERVEQANLPAGRKRTMLEQHPQMRSISQMEDRISGMEPEYQRRYIDSQLMQLQGQVPMDELHQRMDALNDGTKQSEQLAAIAHKQLQQEIQRDMMLMEKSGISRVALRQWLLQRREQL